MLNVLFSELPPLPIRKYARLVGVVLFALYLTACGTNKAQTGKESYEEYVARMLPLSKVGLQQLHRSGTKSFCFSPASINYAMIAVRCGATGASLNELLRFVSPVLNPEEGIDCTLHVSNGVWIDQGLELDKDFTRCLNYNHPTTARPLPLQRNPKASADTINRWSYEATHHRISQLVDASSLQGAELVVTNAIYFHGKWQLPFNEKETRAEPFRTTHGKQTIPTMRMLASRMKYAESDKGKMLILPYEDEDFEMVVYLPAKQDSSTVPPLPRPTFEELRTLYDAAQEKRVMVSLPKFRIRSTFKAIPLLESLGIHAPFKPSKDFIRMTKQKANLYIGRIIQAAEIEVSERSTEASAATAIIMVRSAMPVKEFKANRPFMFMINTRGLYNPIFIGQFNGN